MRPTWAEVLSAVQPRRNAASSVAASGAHLESAATTRLRAETAVAEKSVELDIAFCTSNTEPDGTSCPSGCHYVGGSASLEDIEGNANLSRLSA